MYDIIGDIHGHAEPLKRLLLKMGYQEADRVWQHSSRKVVFVGDYIDRGPAIRETLQIVKRMTESGHAIALMGNHEYNALAYHHRLVDGTYLRKHSTKHMKQHAQTLAQFFFHQEEWQEYLQWFYTLPLFLELDGIRAVHACWDDAHIDWLKQRNMQRISPQFLIKAHRRESLEYTIIDETLKGKEVDIPEMYAWADKDGNIRKQNRIKWWSNPDGNLTYGQALFNCPEPLLEKNIVDHKFYTYPDTEPPIFLGHYWLEAEMPELQRSNVICLDYSIAKDGILVAYRWNKGEEISPINFVSTK
ncbi:MAG: phosphoesterase [Chitinophagaceae bacterium]|nr:MAG: phosphoesterase [Chitinophagaceae bacterium]